MASVNILLMATIEIYCNLDRGYIASWFTILAAQLRFLSGWVDSAAVSPSQTACTTFKESAPNSTLLLGSHKYSTIC